MAAECCPTCGRRFATAKRAKTAPAADPIAIDVASITEVYAHYKRTAPAEDARFAIRAGVALPMDLAVEWAQLVTGIDAGRVNKTDGYRRLQALQADWRRARAAAERDEWRHGGRWAWSLEIPGAAEAYPSRRPWVEVA